MLEFKLILFIILNNNLAETQGKITATSTTETEGKIITTTTTETEGKITNIYNYRN